MRKIITAILFSPLFAVAQESFSIQGDLPGLTDNSKVYLLSADNKDTLAIASINQHSFLLKGKTQETDLRVLHFASLGRNFSLYFGPGDQIKINATTQDWNDITIIGSASQKEYDNFMIFVRPLTEYLTFYTNQVNTARTSSARDSAVIMLNTAYAIFQTSIDHFISYKKSTPIAALALAYSYDTDPNKDVTLLEKRFALLSGDALKNGFAQNIRNVIAVGKVGAIGTQAIDFTQPDENGTPVSLSQFKGKYVLIDFWASWCGPCRQENPHVVAAYNQFKNKNFTVLGVSLDKDKDNWLRAVKSDNLNWTQVSDLQLWNNAAARSYNVTQIPQNFLIDPNGIIIAKNLRGEDLVNKLKEVLK